jgi:hypothetical protein
VFSYLEQSLCQCRFFLEGAECGGIMAENLSAEGDMVPATAATLGSAGGSIVVCGQVICRSFDVVVRIPGSLQARRVMQPAVTVYENRVYGR